jgi:hypothetical protein
MVFPAVSVTAVEIFTLYVVDTFCPLVLKTAWLPVQFESVHPGLFDVIFDVLTVPQLMFSSQIIVTLLSTATLIAPSNGDVELTDGAVLSTVTVFPVPGVSRLLAVSVALLRIIYVPSTGRDQLYVHVTFIPGQPEQDTGFQLDPPFVDTSIPETPILSDAEPLIVYGDGELLFSTAPCAGIVTVDEGDMGSAPTVV